jgi:hypothetical protein
MFIPPMFCSDFSIGGESEGKRRGKMKICLREDERSPSVREISEREREISLSTWEISIRGREIT